MSPLLPTAAIPGTEAAPDRYAGPRFAVPTALRTVAKIVIAAALLIGVAYNLIGFPLLDREWGQHYRLDLDVYRIGGSAVFGDLDLYGVLPTTFYDIALPFTYPPISAIAFSPMSLLPLVVASAIMTALSIVLLALTVYVTLRALMTLETSTRLWTTAAITAVALALEPVYSTLDYGQINIVLMCLVVLDVLLRRTPWPRGTLIGLVTAIKLTPAVFVLYFLLKRDYRAALVSGVSFLVFTAIAFALTFSNSVEYWTDVIIDSDRIGNPSYISNQSMTGMLARFGLADGPRTVLWILLGAIMLGIAVVAIRESLRAGEKVLALTVTAALGLLVSPVSWSHHWVWTVPLLTALGYLALRRQSITLTVLTLVGAELMYLAPHWRIADPTGEGLDLPLLDRIAASSYVWWAMVTLIVVALLPRLGRRQLRARAV